MQVCRKISINLLTEILNISDHNLNITVSKFGNAGVRLAERLDPLGGPRAYERLFVM